MESGCNVHIFFVCFVYVMSLPPHIQLLQSVHNSSHLGTYCPSTQCSYIVGFFHGKHAIYTSRRITKNVRIDMSHHIPNVRTKMIDTENGKQVFLYFEDPVPISISKEDSPQFDWIIEQAPGDQFISYPIINHLGLIMPFDLMDENQDHLVYKSYVIDPMQDMQLFRQGLTGTLD